MSDRKAQMLADRYLRDSARALVDADIEHIKADFAHKGLGERAMDRVTDGAMDLYEEAIEVAEDNKGALAALIAAVVVWFARNPILAAFGLAPEGEDEEDDDGWDLRDELAERLGR
ncbi:hypothetical protein [Erythrobacter sp. SD-21]|uniref:hypothetical protein n=1 Tax=Erythrobacter sp. SD-21 TaxID=161528 RepID=UPI000153F569|nr:hypothetical protein [Erythrobacter sp. SD-21]EDL50209.1 hypothetical protein ED21_27098 [Erythrobacter sp. SD-21]